MSENGMRSVMKRIVHSGLPVPRFFRPVIRGAYRAGVVFVELFAFLLKLLWIEPVLRSVCDSVGKNLRAERLPYMRGKGLIRIGDHVNLSGRSCFYFMHDVSESPVIQIGNHSFVGNGCTFSAAERIEVGDHCLVSAAVRIHDNDGHPLESERRLRNERIHAGEVSPVFIEDNVWVGAGATILKGVRIGKNAVVGTGAVVTQDVPADSVVVGNPARIVKTPGDS